MIRMATDEALMAFAQKASSRSIEGGDYWQRAADFLLGLIEQTDISRKQHNWLSQIKQELSDPWD